jgi:hypothetical protein
MKNWEDWAGEALKGRRLHEPPPQLLQEATALGERLPARSSGWPGWMRGLAAASVVGLALLGGTLMLRQAPPSLPDRGVDSMIRGTRVQLQSPSGDLAEAPRALSWQPFEEADHYRVRILAVDDAVLWEAQVSEASAVLPDVVRASLQSAVVYRWSVEAFDADDRLTGRSEPSRFRIKP